MAIVIPNGGEVLALGFLVNKSVPENLKLRLFESNTTPAETDTIATYTTATFTGYADITLTGASWTVTAGAPSTAAYAEQTFTSTAGGQAKSVYGYVYLRLTTGDIVGAERFTDGPYSIVNNGDAVKITPSITAD